MQPKDSPRAEIPASSARQRAHSGQEWRHKILPPNILRASGEQSQQPPDFPGPPIASSMPPLQTRSRAEPSIAMKPILKLTVILTLLPFAAYAIAGRPIRDLLLLCSASADVAVDGALHQIPVEIRDRKLDHDVSHQRQQLTDHQVALNLSRRELDNLAEQVQQLQERSGRRQRLLAEAYPVLQQAMVEERTQVEFAGSVHTLGDFKKHLDALLAEDEREQRVLAIRGEGLQKLQASVTDGELALVDMRSALLSLEQEIELLRARREQAELDGKTLDMVAAASAATGVSTSVGKETERLRNEVTKLEVGNEARRSTVPGAAAKNVVVRDWDRLERLKAIHSGSAAPVIKESGENLR